MRNFLASDVLSIDPLMSAVDRVALLLVMFWMMTSLPALAVVAEKAPMVKSCDLAKTSRF